MKLRLLIGIILISWCEIVAQPQLKKKYDVYDQSSVKTVYTRQGYNMTLLMNNHGALRCPPQQGLYGPCISLEYPPGAMIDHLFAAGIIVGAIVVDSTTLGEPNNYRAVMEGYNVTTGTSEVFSIDSLFWRTSTDSINAPNRRFYDDDADGKIDEDELNGVDDDNDGRVDEDFGAVSDNDLYVSYADTFRTLMPPSYRPLGLKVTQRSFAWKSLVKDPFIPIEYNIINIGHNTLKDVYIGIMADFDVGPINVSTYFRNNYIGIYPNLRTVYVHNPLDRGSTPAGVMFLGTSDGSIERNSIQYILRDIDLDVCSDSCLFWLLSCQVGGNCTIPDTSSYVLEDKRLLYAIGPFEAMRPGDTLTVTTAFISGDNLSEGPYSIMQSAEKALSFYRRNFVPPPIPPSPPLHITTEKNKVVLDWQWREGDLRPNPLDVWDANNDFLNGLPSEHPRRQSNKGLSGGRNFEGFKIWRSESQTLDTNSFTLIAQYDMDDDLGFGFQSGLRFTYADSNLRQGNQYWYAVTSYSIPEVLFYYKPDSVGGLAKDTIVTNYYVESDIKQNATQVRLNFGPSQRYGEVKVVPNPYFGNVYYTDGNGFEGSELDWNDTKRVIWFIDLPEKATIRIYSLVGDIIATIEHNDVQRTAAGHWVGQEEWKLFSESGRPIASGVYVFSVESDFGTQIGKFVVIR